MSDRVLLALKPGGRPADWQEARLPAYAVSVADGLPAFNESVLGWLSAPDVAIYFMPAVVWRTRNRPGYDDWWSGLPAQYIDLRLHQWSLTHWASLPSSQPPRLWAVHIPGPDDLYAAASEKDALALAQSHNLAMLRRWAKDPLTENDPLIESMMARTIPWPHGAAAHAAALARQQSTEG